MQTLPCGEIQRAAVVNDFESRNLKGLQKHTKMVKLIKTWQTHRLVSLDVQVEISIWHITQQTGVCFQTLKV